MNIYPLLMAPYFRHGEETPWGGSMLRDAFMKDAPDDRTGESLEISALSNRESMVRNGLHAGKTLRRMIELWGEELTGPMDGEFPLLLKLLDAQQTLSVQVHPGDDYAMAHDGKLGKSEAWVVLNCDPGAKIAYGLDTHGEDLRAIVESGRLEDALHWETVRPGDVRAAALGRHEDACGAAGTDGGSHVSGDFAHHGILEHQRDGRNQDIRVPRSPAYRVFARRAALSARFEHGSGRHGVGAHAEQLRALRQKRRKRGDDGAADAAALSVQNDDGHNCLRIVKSFVNSGNRFRQNRPRPAGCVRCPSPYRKRKTHGFRPPPWRA